MKYFRIIGFVLVFWALLIHARFILSVPDPVFAPDSATYDHPALNLLFGKAFNLPPQRTAVYPLFLYAALKLSGSFTGVLVIQHALAVLTGLGAAFFYYRFMRKSKWGALFIFFGSAALRGREIRPVISRETSPEKSSATSSRRRPKTSFLSPSLLTA